MPTTRRYLDSYFENFSAGPFNFLQRRPLIRWFEEQATISGPDRLLVYVLLALGASISGGSTSEAYGREFASIAFQGLESLAQETCVQLVQAQILMSQYCSHVGSSEHAWRLTGSACRSVLGLRIQSEEVCNQIGSKSSLLGLSGPGLVECCRRTFWSAYILDVSVSFLDPRFARCALDTDHE